MRSPGHPACSHRRLGCAFPHPWLEMPRVVQALAVSGKHNPSGNRSGFSTFNPGKPAALFFSPFWSWRNGWREGAESNTLLQGGEKGFCVL